MRSFSVPVLGPKLVKSLHRDITSSVPAHVEIYVNRGGRIFAHRRHDTNCVCVSLVSTMDPQARSACMGHWDYMVNKYVAARTKSFSYLLRKCHFGESCCCLKFVGAIVTRTCLASMVLWLILDNLCPRIRLHIRSAYSMHAFLVIDACCDEFWHNSHLTPFFVFSPLFSHHRFTPLPSSGNTRASLPLFHLEGVLHTIGASTFS
jgi:hypothetical protein